MVEEIIARLKAEHQLLVQAAEMARGEATDAESQARSKYDTRAQEAAYLAEGQAKLATDLAHSIRVFQGMDFRTVDSTRTANIGSLIELASPGSESFWYFIAPRAGGMEINFAGRTVLVITTQSPLGQKLLGRREGESLSIIPKGPGQRIVSIM